MKERGMEGYGELMHPEDVEVKRVLKEGNEIEEEYEIQEFK